MAKRASRSTSLGQAAQSELMQGQDTPAEAPEEQITETPVEPEAPPETPEPEAEPEPETPADPESPSFLSRLGELGFEGVETEQDAQERLIEAYRQQQEQIEAAQQERQQLEQLARYGNQYLAQLREQERSQTQGQAPSQQAPTQQTGERQEAPDPWWRPPEYDARWVEKWREMDPQTGQPRWKADTPPEVISKTQAYTEYVDDWQYRLLTNPLEALRPAVFGALQEDPAQTQQIFEPMFERYYQARRQQEDNQAFWQQVRQENEDWMFERDPRTNKPTGKLTREAEEVVRLGDSLIQGGLTDPAMAWEAARAMYANRLAASQPAESAAPAPTPQETRQQKRRDFTRAHAGSVASRGGSTRRETQEPAVQNANLSPGRQVVQMMEDNGDL